MEPRVASSLVDRDGAFLYHRFFVSKGALRDVGWQIAQNNCMLSASKNGFSKCSGMLF